MEGERQEKRIRGVVKKIIFSLARMHLKGCKFLYLIFGKSVCLALTFSAKLRLIQRHGSQITGLRLKTV